MKSIQFINQSQKRNPQKFVRWWLKHLVPILKKKKVRNHHWLAWDLTLVFVSSQEGKKINQQFRGKNYATDVLSFAPTEENSLGELVFCPKVIEKQAQEQKWGYQWELAYMLTHGVLHLLGYDHELSKKEEEIMFTLQDEVFDTLVKSYKTK